MRISRVQAAETVCRSFLAISNIVLMDLTYSKKEGNLKCGTACAQVFVQVWHSLNQPGANAYLKICCCEVKN
jgi:hypothetical protein